VLTRGDLPSTFADKGVAPADHSRCSAWDPNLHQYVETADVSGHDFERSDAAGYAFVGSEASVFRSRADALGDWRRSFVDPKVEACIAEELRKAAGPHVTFTGLKVTPLDLRANGTWVRVWDATAVLHEQGRSAPIEFAAAGYLEGRVGSLLEMLSIGDGISQQLSARLSASMTSRLSAAQRLVR
jgi:hypothetical protein